MIARLRLAAAARETYAGGHVIIPTGFTRLPYSALEARAVTRAFGAADTIEISGFEATPARCWNLRSTDSPSCTSRPTPWCGATRRMQSALYLSEIRCRRHRARAERLTASEIGRTGLHADLVVLSGCATGDGSAMRGEGVLGLTYAIPGERRALRGGCVVARSQDASTARLMSEFYKAYRKTGRAAEALRVRPDARAARLCLAELRGARERISLNHCSMFQIACVPKE